MVVEGINFIDEAVKKLSRSAFIRAHVTVFFLDRDVSERKRILGDIYDRIVNS